MIALGPVLDDVLPRPQGRDATVLYAHVRPFDAAACGPCSHPEVVLVEPWLAGTSAHVVADALHDRPHRLLALGVGRARSSAATARRRPRRATASTLPASALDRRVPGRRGLSTTMAPAPCAHAALAQFGSAAHL